MIQSNLELVQEIAANMKSSSQNVALNNVEMCPNTDTPIQIECTMNFSKTKIALESFKEVVQRDADSIVDVALRFDEKDEELANEIRG